MINRLICFSLFAESDAEIVMRHPATRILFQSACVQGKEIVIFRCLPPRQKAEQYQ
jgi:hypothetical protein